MTDSPSRIELAKVVHDAGLAWDKAAKLFDRTIGIQMTELPPAKRNDAGLAKRVDVASQVYIDALDRQAAFNRSHCFACDERGQFTGFYEEVSRIACSNHRPEITAVVAGVQ